MIIGDPDGMYTKTKANANNLPDDSKDGKKGRYGKHSIKLRMEMGNVSMRQQPSIERK